MEFETLTITYEDLLRAMCERPDNLGPCTAHVESATKIWKKLKESNARQ